MRRIILASILCSLFANSIDAQIKKGALFLGGDISGATQKTKTDGTITDKQNGFNISPVIGKAVKDNLVLGFFSVIGFYNVKNSVSGGLNNKTNTYSLGAFLRKYKNIGTGGFYIFVQGGLSAALYRQKLDVAPTSPASDERRILFTSISAYPGISYAISKKLHLETGFNNLLLLSYSNEKREIGNPVTSTIKTNAFSLSSSLNNASSSLYLGFRLLLNKG